MPSNCFLLTKAVELRFLYRRPKIKLKKGTRRESIIDDAAEALLLDVAAQALRDVVILVRDMGFRPEEVFRMRWEHVHWEKRVYFNPFGKTKSPGAGSLSVSVQPRY